MFHEMFQCWPLEQSWTLKVNYPLWCLFVQLYVGKEERDSYKENNTHLFLARNSLSQSQSLLLNSVPSAATVCFPVK